MIELVKNFANSISDQPDKELRIRIYINTFLPENERDGEKFTEIYQAAFN